jgi:general secretion pathway protein A
MYLAYWGLRESPFRANIDPRGFYQNPTHEESLARLHFLVSSQRRLGLLSGEGGCGKSLLLEVFARELRAQGWAVARSGLVASTARELIWSLAAQWDLNPAPAADLGELWQRIADRLAEFRYQKTPAVVLLDDADEARPEVLEQIDRLTRSEQSSGGRLTLVLAAHSDRLSKLGFRLLDLADLRVDVSSWELEDTQGYIVHCLARNGRNSTLFDERAMRRMHELCGGVPRRINQVAELALVAAAGQQLRTVDLHTIETVCGELVVAGDEVVTLS